MKSRICTLTGESTNAHNVGSFVEYSKFDGAKLPNLQV